MCNVRVICLMKRWEKTDRQTKWNSPKHIKGKIAKHFGWCFRVIFSSDYKSDYCFYVNMIMVLKFTLNWNVIDVFWLRICHEIKHLPDRASYLYVIVNVNLKLKTIRKCLFFKRQISLLCFIAFRRVRTHYIASKNYIGIERLYYIFF